MLRTGPHSPLRFVQDFSVLLPVEFVVEDCPDGFDSDWFLTDPIKPSEDGLEEGREGSVEGRGVLGIRSYKVPE